MSETGVHCPECTNRRLRSSGSIATTPCRAVQCLSCGIFYASDEEATAGIDESYRLMTPLRVTLSVLTAPIEGIENRTPREVFDIMCARIRSALRVD